MDLLKHLSIETKKRIAERHIKRFKNRIEAGEKGSKAVNLLECVDYLSLWTSFLEAVEKGEKTSTAQDDELADALYSGDCDDLLTADELQLLKTLE